MWIYTIFNINNAVIILITKLISSLLEISNYNNNKENGYNIELCFSLMIKLSGTVLNNFSICSKFFLVYLKSNNTVLLCPIFINYTLIDNVN